ncbi:hypothetical protein Prudu_003377 [Prunus dulcis]|uniref:Uncharacterized protein n=1 Tax=Prunus dulcis TaxID=3755 RepID=A0A4Y1QSX9_PRUDU|nr:hypothetical protein Prudu_003377 [Prunus dulcis]
MASHFAHVAAWVGLACGEVPGLVGLKPCPGLPLPVGAIRGPRPCLALAKGLAVDLLLLDRQNIKDSVYVEELGTTLSRDEIFKILVADVLEGVLEVDWRDLFPYLRRWVPNNKSLEMKIQGIYFRRKAVLMNSLIKEQTNRIASGEGIYRGEKERHISRRGDIYLHSPGGPGSH